MSDQIEVFDNDELNKKLTENLKKYEDEVAASFDELLDEFTKSYKQLSQAQPDTPENKVAENTWNQLLAKYSKQSSGDKFEGYFFGVQRVRDWMEIGTDSRQAKIDMWNEKGQDALKSGDLHLIKQTDSGDYVRLKFDQQKNELLRNEDIDEIPDEAEQVASNKWVIPIRTEARWDGDEQLGKPLPKHSYFRNIFGVARPKGSDKPFRPVSMTVSGDDANNLDFPTFKPVEFSAFVSDDSEEREGIKEKQLNFARGTDIKELDEDKFDIDLEGFIEEHLQQYLNTVPELDEFVDTLGDNDYNKIVITKGRIDNMRLQPNDNGNKGFVLNKNSGFSMPEYGDDGELDSVYCVVREDIDLEFGEGSYGYVVGTTFRGDPQEDSDRDKGDPVVMARGVFVPEDSKIPKPDDVEDVDEGDINLGSSSEDDNNEDQEESTEEDPFSDAGEDFGDDEDFEDDW